MEISKKRMNWGEMVVPSLTLVFGIAYFYQTIHAPKIALYWPIMIAVVVLMLWVAVLVRFVFAGPKSPQHPERQRPLKNFSELQPPVLIFCGAIVYLLAVPWLGFSISNYCFMLIIFRGLGSTKWTQNLLVALGITVFLHVALIVLMKLSLPQLELGLLTI